MPDKAIVLVALRVLNACGVHVAPDAADVAEMRRSVSGPQADWEPARLATYIVQREVHDLKK
jgi:hypothetical protein